MVILYFLGLSVALALLVIFLWKTWVQWIASILYLSAQIGLTWYAYQNPGQSDSVYFRFDGLSILLNVLLSIILVPVFLHTRFYLQRHVRNIKMNGLFVGLLIILATSITAVYFADNIVLMWVCLEISTVAVTFLVFHERYTDALEAAWKYLFISSFGITLAFVGILFLSVQGQAGTEVSLSFSHLKNIANELDPFFLQIAFILILTGYSIKMNIFPLYAAAIDAKTAAPFPVNAITSSALVNAGFLAIARVYSIITQTAHATWANHILMIVGMISLAIATFQLFRVKRFKRMFAFSTMEHMALVCIALSLGKPGYFAALLHISLHTLAKTGMFLSFGQIRAYFQSGWIKDTGDYFKRSGFSAIVYLFGLLTITAIPPSGMFYSEFLIFKALFADEHYYIMMAVLVFLTIIFYILFSYSMQLLYGSIPENYQPEKSIVNKWEPVSQIILFVLVIYLAFFPPPVFIELLISAMQLLS